MAVQQVSIAQAFAGPSITVFGNPVSDIPFSPEQARLAGMSRPDDVKGFARIRAFRIGNGPCVRLPVPSLLVVFGAAQDISDGECGFSAGEVSKWTYGFGTQVFAFEPSAGAAEDVLESLATRGIDGGLQFENPRYENGKLCVDVHIWARISVLGATAKFDERFPVCVSVGQQCFTVWEIGFANLQICYRAPNQICGKLCVGKFGLEKCWEQCVTIPLPLSSAPLATSSHPCECQKQPSFDAALVMERTECVSVTIENGKACLNVPIYGNVCVSVPSSVPSGTVAEACIDVCKRFGVPCGVKVYIKIAGNTVACKDWGCCDC